MFASSIETLLFFVVIKVEELSSALQFLGWKKNKKYYEEDKDSNPSKNYKHCNDEACARIAHVCIPSYLFKTQRNVSISVCNHVRNGR